MPRIDLEHRIIIARRDEVRDDLRPVLELIALAFGYAALTEWSVVPEGSAQRMPITISEDKVVVGRAMDVVDANCGVPTPADLSLLKDLHISWE